MVVKDEGVSGSVLKILVNYLPAREYKEFDVENCIRLQKFDTVILLFLKFPMKE